MKFQRRHGYGRQQPILVKGGDLQTGAVYSLPSAALQYAKLTYRIKQTY